MVDNSRPIEDPEHRHGRWKPRSGVEKKTGRTQKSTLDIRRCDEHVTNLDGVGGSAPRVRSRGLRLRCRLCLPNESAREKPTPSGEECPRSTQTTSLIWSGVQRGCRTSRRWAPARCLAWNLPHNQRRCRAGALLNRIVAASMTILRDRSWLVVGPAERLRCGARTIFASTRPVCFRAIQKAPMAPCVAPRAAAAVLGRKPELRTRGCCVLEHDRPVVIHERARVVDGDWSRAAKKNGEIPGCGRWYGSGSHRGHGNPPPLAHGWS